MDVVSRRVQLPGPDLRCAYCHGAATAALPCSGCGTLLHADCAAQAPGCPTLGCMARVDPALPGKPRRHARQRRLVAAGVLAMLLGSCVLTGLALHGALQHATKPWTQRLAERIDPDELRRECDLVMAAPPAHGEYESPEANFPTGTLRPVDVLPDSIRDLDPHHVRVEADHVWVVWDGEVMTSFGLIVLRDLDADPYELCQQRCERLYPGVWAYVD